MLTGTWPLVIAIALSGCEKNLLAEIPDAAGPDARHIDGDFSCVNTPWPTTAPDPLAVSGQLLGQGGTGINNVVVEIHAVGSDALLAQATTQGQLTNPYGIGHYSASVATAGAAPAIYRKYSPPGYLDHYEYDPMPEFNPKATYANLLQTQSGTEYYDSLVGLAPDPTKGNLIITITDCGLQPASERGVAGATVEAPPGARVVYVNAMQAPDPTQTETVDVGGGPGAAIVLNLAPGPADITIHAGAVTYRTWPVQIYANAWTISERKP